MPLQGSPLTLYIQDLFDRVPAGLNPNVTAWLVYDETKPMPAAAYQPSWDATFDDFLLTPVDKTPRLPAPDHAIVLNVMMKMLGDGKN
jgi:iron transport multicopper oxidase